MCNLKRTGPSQGATKLPPHGGHYLDWVRKSGLRVGLGIGDEFNYVAPVVKYSPAAFQPGPVYISGLAAAVGHQPFNYQQPWVAYSTPKQTDYSFFPSYKGSQSAASYAISQRSMSQLLAMRSVNSGR